MGPVDTLAVLVVVASPQVTCTSPPPFQASFPLISGDIMVTDAPPLSATKDQCKNGGWQTYGVFKNQGACVSFVAAKGKNQPSGP